MSDIGEIKTARRDGTGRVDDDSTVPDRALPRPRAEKVGK
jgi:hypothetical protein